MDVRSDRRLALTADRARVVEESDQDARSILCERGHVIPPDEVKRLGLEVKGGRVVQQSNQSAERPLPAPKRAKKRRKGSA